MSADHRTDPPLPQRAALYVRVSTEEQASEGLSLDAQLRALRAYCATHGLVEAAVFVDAGESARTDARPEFQRMIGLARKKPRPFDSVLVHKTDRFARNREDSAVYKSLLRKECGIEVISVTEQFDDSPAGKLTEGILETIAEFYSANLSQEVKKGMVEAARRGRALGLPPLGYRIQAATGRLEPVDTDAAVVRWIFAQYAAGAMGFNALARHLARGLPPQSPRSRTYKWSAQAVKVILKNRTYLGEFRWRVHDGKTPPIVVPDAHPALVDPETFATVQARLGRSRTPRTRWGDYPLRGLGRCAECGATLTFYRSQSRPNRRTGQRATRDLLVCSAYYRGQCTGGYHNWIVLADAEAAVRSILEAVAADRLPVSPHQVIWTERDTWRHQLNGVRKRLDMVASRAERQLVAYEEGVLTLEEFQAAKRRLAAEREALEVERRALEERIATPTVPLDVLRERILAALHPPSEGPPAERRRQWQTVVDHFTWSRRSQTLHIVFRL